MNLDSRRIMKFLGIYVLQVGALWGLLEGYTYFKGDALKASLGVSWVLIYIVPILTTAYIFRRETSDEKAPSISISTKGNFSPGKVEGSYTIKTQPNQAMDVAQQPPSEDIPRVEAVEPLVPESGIVISTKGNYSPGEVGGDYHVES